jgi:predicted nucleic acid-binding protein
MLIFDSSTLILLAKVELLDVFLGGMSLMVAVPPEVEKECCGHKKTLDSMVIQRAIDESRIDVIAVKDKKLISKLELDFSLGAGESAAVVLAITQQAGLLGIDDKSGINAGKFLGIPFTTAVNILIVCREKGLLSRTEALTRLEQLAKYGRYKRLILEDAKARLETEK